MRQNAPGVIATHSQRPYNAPMDAPTNRPRTILVAVRVDPAIIARIDAEAARLNERTPRMKATRSTIIRAAVEAEIARMERRPSRRSGEAR